MIPDPALTKRNPFVRTGISVDHVIASQRNQTLTNLQLPVKSYDAGVPFCAGSIRMKGNKMKRILFSMALLFCTPALADAETELGYAYQSINSSYAKIRVASDNCGYPAGEWMSFKTRVLSAMSLDPRIDVIAVDREMDRFYEGEKSRMSRPMQ